MKLSRYSLPRLERLDDRTTPARIVGWVTDEVLITFQPGTSHETRQLAWDSVHATLLETIGTQAMQDSGSPAIDRLRLATPSVEQAIATLGTNPTVLFAEPNYKLERLTVADDPA